MFPLLHEADSSSKHAQPTMVSPNHTYVHHSPSFRSVGRRLLEVFTVHTYVVDSTVCCGGGGGGHGPLAPRVLHICNTLSFYFGLLKVDS